MLSFTQYVDLQENTIVDLKKYLVSFGYDSFKDLSKYRFAVYVPAKERMRVAEKIADNMNGELASTGNNAGKPVVSFDGGMKVLVKPIPGSGVGGTAKEDAQLLSLQNQIEQHLADSNLMELPVKIGRRTYMVAGAASTPGTPKSDFHLLDSEGREVAWISHKDGSSARHFQQWGGMTPKKEPDIFNHEESQAFITDVKNMFGGIMPRATTVSREIKDRKLANMSVYGNAYGGAMGRQNVTLMLQGPVTMIKKRDAFEITSNHTAVNGDRMTGAYKPVFMAMYKCDRSNFKIQCARFAIQPEGSRKSTTI